MTQVLTDCYIAALGGMSADGPKAMQARAQFEANERQTKDDVSIAALCRFLQNASLNDVLRKAIHLAISKWDVAQSEDAWTNGTQPRTRERRLETYRRLGLSESDSACTVFDDLFPLDAEAAVVISENFEPWYTPEFRKNRGSFYYAAYARYLETKKNWSAPALASLDESSTQIVERLTDPQRIAAHQSKGLIVGYVQSGKTANFTGVIAKAIDAGYRLIIVLAGTIDVLRKQTQRRIDMELVGKENILRGVDPTDADLMAHVDYQSDADWDEKFSSFGFLPSSQNQPDIIRLTSARFDYKSLKAGIVALEFEKADRTKPLHSPANLPQSSARIVVIKKNKAVLNKLVRDLKSTKTPGHEIPALIIDDESDQASVNTSDPEKWREGETERTAINKAISGLLKLLPRAQYVGYTATPFANVFIDPSDTDDIFPKDFLISLPRPTGYMGVSDFHDLNSPMDPAERTIANSNEKAFVRDAVDQQGVPKLQECVDAYVLSGALKLFRQAKGQGSFRHHTMLVHESVKQIEHWELAEQIRGVWRSAGYRSLSGLNRLREMYANDFLPICKARAEAHQFPTDFDELKQHVSATVDKVTVLGDPVMIVNGDKEMASEEVDFDKREVWRILVGGTKLSRGFTIEGLTISYYRRKTKQADTLMQMGRWFGFRAGYQDLVRLYIGRAEPDGANGKLDLYEAFGAIVRDEEAFRDQLKKYSVLVDGHPQITPKDIPPLVSQHLPWLRPAARNKMFNAELVVRRSVGSLVIPTGYPTDEEKKRHNYFAVLPLLASADTKVELVIPEAENMTKSSFDAWIGEAETSLFLAAIDGIRWITSDYYQPDKAFLHEVASQIRKWVVIAPQTGEKANVRNLPDVGPRTIFKRGLKPPTYKLWGEPTDRKHRPAAQLVGGNCPYYDDPILNRYRGNDVGAVLIYPMAPEPSALPDSPKPHQVVMAAAWITPAAAAPGTSKVVQFRAKNSAYPDEAIVPVRFVGDKQFDSLSERSRAYVAKHFGTDSAARIASEIGSVMAGRSPAVLTLDDVEHIAADASVDATDVLAVLALLARPTAELLRMEYRSKNDTVTLSIEDVTKRLRSWWRNKDTTEEAWRSWAETVSVRWIPIGRTGIRSDA